MGKHGHPKSKAPKLPRAKRPGLLYVRGAKKGWIIAHAMTPLKAVGRRAFASRQMAIDWYCHKVKGGTFDQVWPQAERDGFSARKVSMQREVRDEV